MRQASPWCPTDLPVERATPLHRYYHAPAPVPSRVPPALAYSQAGSRVQRVGLERPPRVRRLASLGSAGTLLRGYGNINPLSIDYACRPRLRSRLTLGGLAWPRNPWSSGGGVSHSSFATHACILTRVASTAGFLRRSPRHTTLPYPPPPLARPRRNEQGKMEVPRLRRCA